MYGWLPFLSSGLNPNVFRHQYLKRKLIIIRIEKCFTHGANYSSLKCNVKLTLITVLALELQRSNDRSCWRKYGTSCYCLFPMSHVLAHWE